MARFEVRGKLYSPEEISAQVLRKLADDAAKFLGEKVTQAVITVPAYFNDAQRTATKDAGRIAGLEVLRIINEPTAAALAYGLDKKEHETVLVFDLGGGTFDVSILDVGDGVVEVRATAGDTPPGRRRLRPAAGGPPRRRVPEGERHRPAQRPAGAAAAVRGGGEGQDRAEFGHPDAGQPAVRHRRRRRAPSTSPTTVMRSTFEQITGDLVERCLEPVEQAMADAKVGANDLDEVILVGGSTRIPAVQALVRRLTGGKDPNMSVNPDEVVALGAAIQAGVLKGEVRTSCCSTSPRCRWAWRRCGGVMTKIIERNTTIPVRRTRDVLHRRGQPAGR